MERRTFIQALAASTYGVKAYADTPVADNVKAKNIIYIYLDGGMSHIDTFDPNDDQGGMGDTANMGNRGGGQIGHRLPKVAEVMNKAVVIRSTTSKTGAHQQAQYLSRTSYKQLGTITHPSLGSWVSHISDRDKAIPDFVLVNGISTHPGSGFLPKNQSPLPIVDPKDGLKNSKVDDKLQERMALLKVINKKINATIADT